MYVKFSSCLQRCKNYNNRTSFSTVVITYVLLLFLQNTLYMCLLCLVLSASRYDVHMVLGQRLFNPVLRLHHTLDGDVLSLDDCCKFNSDRSHIESVFDTQSRLQSLHLTDQENCLLAAFIVVSPGTNQLFCRSRNWWWEGLTLLSSAHIISPTLAKMPLSQSTIQ